MTNIKFTFEDGSEALAHYGVKGMKWGEWNSQTEQKYASDDQIHQRYQHDHNWDLNSHNGFTGTGGGSFGNNRTVEQLQNQMKQHPGVQAANFITGAQKAAGEAQKAIGEGINQVAKSASDIFKTASRTLSDAGTAAINGGKDLVDSLFGTKFGPAAQGRANRQRVDTARRRRASQEKYAKENAAKNAQLMAQAQERQRQKAVKDITKAARQANQRKQNEINADQRRRKENADNIKKTYESNVQKTRNLRNSVDLAKKRQRVENLKATASERKQNYKNEMSVNRDEFKGDKAGLKKANKRTKDFYGKNGNEAQAREAKRRRANSERIRAEENRAAARRAKKERKYKEAPRGYYSR